MTNTRYKILPDQEQPKKFRVVYVESEYTVSYKKELLHGLSKYKANKMAAMLEAKRTAAIKRLSKAISEWIAINPQPNEQAALINKLSAKHQIGKGTIETAIHALIGGLNAEVKA